jgi:hypothetical protein
MKENNKVKQLGTTRIRTFFSVLLLIVVGSMNLEFVLPPQDFPDILPPPVFLILAAISLIIFIGLWIAAIIVGRKGEAARAALLAQGNPADHKNGEK